MEKKGWIILVGSFILLIIASLAYTLAERPAAYQNIVLGHGGDQVEVQYQGQTKSLDDVLSDLDARTAGLPSAAQGATPVTPVTPPASAGPSTPYLCSMNGVTWTAHTSLSSSGQYLCYEDRTVISGDSYYCTAMWDSSAQSWKDVTVYKYDNHREWWAVIPASGHYAGITYSKYTSCTP